MKNTKLTSKDSSLFLIKNWLNLFLLTVLFYSHFIFYFLWGNHDWQWIKSGTPLLSGVFEGRFSQFILQTILTNGNILPIITIIISLGFYSLTIFILLKIFSFPQQRMYYLLIGLFFTTSPYCISWLYFAFITLSCLSWPFFVTLSFYLLIKSQTSKNYLTLRVLSSILFFLSIGGYPPVINLIGVIFFAIIINNICINHAPIKDTIKKITPFAISIIIALILWLIIQYFLKKYNLQFSTYNTAGISLKELPQRLYQIFLISLKQFTVITTFIPYNYKYLTLCLTLLALFILYTQTPKTLPHIILFILSIIGLLISSVFTTLIAENTNYVTYEPRIEFFGILYIYIFSIIIILKNNNTFIKNITLLIIPILIINNINTLSLSSKIWNLGFKTETLLANRIINRIEENPQFTQNKKYTFVQSGSLNIRGRYYQPKTNENIDSYTLSAPYIPWHLPSKTYKFYTTSDYFGDDFDIFWRFINPNNLNLNDYLIQYLSYKSQPWPHLNSIYIDNNSIILTLTPKGMWDAQKWIKNFY